MSDKQGDYSDLRREYIAQGMTRADVSNDPFKQFATWFDVALEARPDDATSMVLATANASGQPSARIVLLKHFDSQGFAWYTDYESQKGNDLQQNPQAEILFYWYGLERQVRIQGRVEKLGEDEANLYFNKRPVGSQLSAAVSHQSHVIESRQVLEQRVVDLQQQLAGSAVPRPERWGGYRLVPTQFEFWQGRESRLHDRLRYQLIAGDWVIERLQP